MGKSIQKKGSPRTPRASTRAEMVYTVSKRPRVDSKKPKKSIFKKRNLRVHVILHLQINARRSLVIISVVTFFALVIVGVAGFNAYSAQQTAKDSAKPIQLDATINRRIQLMGDAKNYPNEIVNFSNASESLQKYALKDYQKLKSSCIVNNEFIGTVQYAVIAVDGNYAKITKGCDQADSIVLANISDTWTVIFAGNNLPLCADVYAYNVPRGIVPSCVTDSTTYSNPIP